jgi:hypothetical protein
VNFAFGDETSVICGMKVDRVIGNNYFRSGNPPITLGNFHSIQHDIVSCASTIDARHGMQYVVPSQSGIKINCGLKSCVMRLDGECRKPSFMPIACDCKSAKHGRRGTDNNKERLI